MVPCGCILSKFYIKPQLVCGLRWRQLCCILSKFYIKPQHFINARDRVSSCILSKFYIKPQPRVPRLIVSMVVSYRNSTSNHNQKRRDKSYQRLYLIEILHQTTTDQAPCLRAPPVVSYRNSTSNHNHSCHHGEGGSVVSYRNSTSNHNNVRVRCGVHLLYLIEILHQTTTSGLILIDKVLLTGCLPL